MSGYMEVKLPTMSTRGFTTWKTWKKQWCILRPQAVKQGIIVVLHASAGMSSTSQVEIPKGSIICRTISKVKDYAFGIYSSINSQRSLLLMAGQSESESQLWMLRMRAMLDGKDRTDNNHHTDNNFTVSVIENDFSNACGFKGLYGVLKITSDYFEISDTTGQTKAHFTFTDISSIDLIYNANTKVDNQRILTVRTNSNFKHGLGQFSFFCLYANLLTNKLRNKLLHLSPEIVFRKLDRRISRSEGTLFTMDDFKEYSFESERDSGLSSCEPISSKSKSKWYYSLQDPSIRLSVNDKGYFLKGKVASTLISAGVLLSTPGHTSKAKLQHCDKKVVKSSENILSRTQISDFSECSFDRRSSGVSVASGHYEEISEQNLIHKNPRVSKAMRVSADNTYEALVECIYGTARRQSKKILPPPLPPRHRIHSGKFDSASDSGVEEESLCSIINQEASETKSCSIHSSIGSLSSLPQYLMCETESTKGSLKYGNKLHTAFDVFRKRVQSDTHHLKGKFHNGNKVTACQCDAASITSSETSSITQKKKFDSNVTPSKPINMLRNSKMARALRRLGGGSHFNDMKDSAKSCENLESFESNILTNKRCSKSEENLDLNLDAPDINGEFENLNIELSPKWYGDKSDDNIKDLSVICADNSFKNAYPEDILELVLRGETKLIQQKLKKRAAEEEYIPMSPCGYVESIACEKLSEAVNSEAEIENNYMVMKSV
ncbi:uncharacterized protein LOC143923188 [Arctopsyche grandis]|uniref:uncharacterized protein LOC143923188 n=1 Tax=Arctopsyche grandis TaxID=121162 RepID=UPI00406D92DF